MAKAKKIANLNPDEPLEVSLPKILGARFEEMIIHEAGTIEGSDIEALHDMRVASRRVQAVLKIFRDFFPKKKFKAEYSEIRSLIRALGEVRDYDVLIDKLEKMKNNTGAKSIDNRAMDLLIIRKKTEREEKRKLLIKHLDELNQAGYKEHFYKFIENSV
jgi:CHAD domain-containing protein